MVARWFFHHWQRKCVALVVALVLWLFINQSITETKVIPNVPIRIINLPKDKTIIGLLPNGFLEKRVALTLNGSHDVVEALEPGDLEVVINASVIDRGDWIANITKNNLVSLNPNIDLDHHIFAVSHSEFFIKIRPVVTEEVPVTITTPKGEAPEGYLFLDLWPHKFTQKVTGPENEVRALKARGIKVVLDLDKITQEELDKIREEQRGGDEVSFVFHRECFRVPIPFQRNFWEECNDPQVKTVTLNFLRQNILPVGEELPIRVFYPLESIGTINPLTHPLVASAKVRQENGLFFLTTPLYLKNVSRRFLNVIRGNIEITLVAAPPSAGALLDWDVAVIDPEGLEETYIAYMLANEPKEFDQSRGTFVEKQKRAALRHRFSEYKEVLMLWVKANQPLSLESALEKKQITVR